MAFEVKRKFILNEKQKERLLDGAILLNEENFTNEYYDNEKFSLGSNDMWLYKRGELFHLKIPIRQNDEKSHKYNEIKGEMAIREIFAIPTIGSFEQDLKSFGHECYCEFKTQRKKYKKDNFVINLNKMEFGDWKFQIAEIELLVEKENEVKQAEKKIYNFAKNCGMKSEHVNIKIVEFLKRKMPERYKLLKENKII